MKKRINAKAAMIMLKLSFIEADNRFDEFFNEFPDDPNGKAIDSEDVRAAFGRIKDKTYKEFLGLFGELPEVSTSEPAVKMYGYTDKLTVNNTGEKMGCDGVLYDKMRFSKLGPDYGKEILLVWSNGDKLHVPNTRKMTMLATGRKFQPGGKYSNNPDIPTMEVYADKGAHPQQVTMYFNSAV